MPRRVLGFSIGRVRHYVMCLRMHVFCAMRLHMLRARMHMGAGFGDAAMLMWSGRASDRGIDDARTLAPQVPGRFQFLCGQACPPSVVSSEFP
eukprot:2590730-Lingulodinium_polyedra.AAC.1